MVRLLSVVEIKLILSFLSEIVRLLSEDFLIIWLHLLLVYPPNFLFFRRFEEPQLLSDFRAASVVAKLSGILPFL